MTDIFQEVEEDYRREQLEKLAKKYGPYVLAAAIGILVLTAGYQGYKSWRSQEAERASVAYNAAGEALAQDPKGAAQAFAAVAAKGGGFGFIARFREAEALATAGNISGAVKILDQVAAGRDGDKVLRDVAILKTGYLLLDKASRSELEKRLSPLLTPENPWRFHAQELLAFSAVRSGETAKAVDAFIQLSRDPESQPSLKARAADMVVELGGTRPQTMPVKPSAPAKQ